MLRSRLPALRECLHLRGCAAEMDSATRSRWEAPEGNQRPRPALVIRHRVRLRDLVPNASSRSCGDLRDGGRRLFDDAWILDSAHQLLGHCQVALGTHRLNIVQKNGFPEARRLG